MSRARNETRLPPRLRRIENPALIEHPNRLGKVRKGSQVHSPDLGFGRGMSTRLGTLEHPLDIDVRRAGAQEREGRSKALVPLRFPSMCSSTNVSHCRETALRTAGGIAR